MRLLSCYYETTVPIGPDIDPVHSPGSISLRSFPVGSSGTRCECAVTNTTFEKTVSQLFYDPDDFHVVGPYHGPYPSFGERRVGGGGWKGVGSSEVGTWRTRGGRHIHSQVTVGHSHSPAIH